MEEKKHWPLILLIGAGAFILVFIFDEKGGASGIGAAPSENLSQLEAFNLQAATLEDNFIAQRNSTVAGLITSHETAQDNLTLGIDTLAAQTQQAQINATSAEDIANIQSNALIQGQRIQANATQSEASIIAKAETTVAATNAAAETQVSNNQTQAINNQTNAQSQNGILGFIGAIAAGLGL